MSELESFRVLLVDDDVSLLESVEAILADQFAVGMLRKPFSPQQSIERVNQFAGIAHSRRWNTARKAAPGDHK